MTFLQPFRIGITIALIWLSVFSVPAVVKAGLNSSAGKAIAADYAVSINTAQTSTGNTITVNWTAPDGHSPNDFLRLHKVSDGDNVYAWSEVLGAAASGSFNVSVPNTVARYEFRLFNASNNQNAAQSTSFAANKPNFSVSSSPSTITAGGQITVDWTAPANRPVTDLLVITPANNASVISQEFTNGLNPKTIKMKAPAQPGQYEVRYLEANASQPSAIGQIITVESAAGSFAGQVKNAENGAYIAGALVEVMQSNVVKAYAVTNSNGAYSIPVSASGTYDIKVSAAGFPNATRAGLVLQSGGTVTADFTLSNTGTLSGQITRSGGGGTLPVSGAFIRIKQGNTVIANGVTNSSGNYSFLRLPPGTYSAEISAGGYNPLTQNSISITAGETTSLNFSMVQNQSGGSNNLEYVYDNAGRLSATKEQGILKNIYNYDLTGNLLSITSPQGTAPAIIAFTPGTGQSGTQVVIQGINFSENAGENAVSFNGTSAVISSFSSSEIVTSVPIGATTGNIIVTTPDGTSVSGSPFIIGSTTGNAAPFISSFSPHLGHPGDPVTITGGNFESETSDNSVLIGSIATSVTSGTSSSLVVPANSSSGRISVTTPNGMALSADEFVTVPAAVDLSSVIYGGKTWFGNYKSVNIPANDKRSVITFDASVGKRFSVQLFSLSSGVKIDIYRPDGRLMSTNNFAPSLPPLYLFIDTQDVSISGTYTIVTTPLSLNGIPPSFIMLVHDVPPDIIDEIPVYGQKQVWFGTPGQNGVLTFNATAGQKILMKIEDNTFDGIATVRRFSTTSNTSTPVGSGVGYVVGRLNYSADGMTIPSTGAYSIFLDPAAAATGTMSVSLRFVPPDPVFSMSIGETETFSTLQEGQNAWVQFSGTAGQRVSLLLRDETYANGFYIYFTRPEGSVWRNWVYGDGNTFVDTMVLPVSGTYKILIDPYGFDTGSFTVDLFNVPPDVVGSTTINGTPVTVNTAVPGHNPAITFDAVQGEQARVSVSNSTLPNGTSFYIVPPGGGILSSANIVNGSGLIHSASLPVTGTYRVEINPQGVTLGGATIAVGGDVYGTIDPGGTPGTVTINNPGQNAWLTFSGTAGQRVSLKLTNVTLGSGTASFRKPDGSILGNTLQIGTNNNFLDTVTLPVNGTYRVLINPGDSTGSATLNMYNVPGDAAGTITVGGDAETRSTTVPGQNLSLELAGSANQRFSLEVSQVTIPANTAIYIKKPDGSVLTSIGTSTNGTILNNIVLPETGTYTILIDPSYDCTGGITLQLFGTGTGSNPTIQFFNSVSVRKGSPQQEDGVFSFSVSVRKGMSSNYSAEREFSNSVSVRFGNIQNHSFGSSVSVTTGPVITALSPGQTARGGSSFTLTVTGTNLSGATAVKFFDANGTLDSSVTVSDITINSAGTALTASIQIGSSGTSGTRTVIVETGSFGSSQPGATGANIFTINP